MVYVYVCVSINIIIIIIIIFITYDYLDNIKNPIYMLVSTTNQIIIKLVLSMFNHRFKYTNKHRGNVLTY